MLVDRYPPMDLFALVPPLLCAFEPVLRELDRLLDDEVIVQRVKADLARRATHSLRRGRPGTPVEVILRLLVVKRLYGWSYEEVERFVADSLVLRQFCRIYCERVPDDTTLLRWANCIAPETLAALNERVVALARQLQVTRGRPSTSSGAAPRQHGGGDDHPSPQRQQPSGRWRARLEQVVASRQPFDKLRRCWARLSSSAGRCSARVRAVRGAWYRVCTIWGGGTARRRNRRCGTPTPD